MRICVSVSVCLCGPAPLMTSPPRHAVRDSTSSAVQSYKHVVVTGSRNTFPASVGNFRFISVVRSHYAPLRLQQNELRHRQMNDPNLNEMYRPNYSRTLRDYCHVTIAVVRMRLAHVWSFGRESPSVLMCSVCFVGYLGDERVFFFIFLSLSL